jgi:hypothetical protein
MPSAGRSQTTGTPPTRGAVVHAAWAVRIASVISAAGSVLTASKPREAVRKSIVR